MKKNLDYYRKNAEEDYITTPISVLRYIGEAEHKITVLRIVICVLLLLCFLSFNGGVLIGEKNQNVELKK